MKYALVVLSCIALTVAAPSIALADVGPPLVLEVTPDTPVGGGDEISVTLSEGDPGSFGLLFFGQEAGVFPFGEVTLDLEPTIFLVLGPFPVDGTFQASITVTDPLPDPLAGQSFLLQGASVGIDFVTGQLVWRASNTDTLAFE